MSNPVHQSSDEDFIGDDFAPSVEGKKTGKFRLSMRVLTPKPEGYVEREARPRGERPRREGEG